MVPSESRSRRPRLDRGQVGFVIVTVVMCVHALVFQVVQDRWWDDPPPIAWIASISITIAGTACFAVLVLMILSTRFPGSVPTLRDLVVAAVVLLGGGFIAVLLGGASALSGFVCLGGAMGEGCSGGSPLLGMVVGGGIVLLTVYVAWRRIRP